MLIGTQIAKGLHPFTQDRPMHVDPLELFQFWLRTAKPSEYHLSEAAQLATVDTSGFPRVRTVLVKSIDEEGLVFYTNLRSPKAVHIQANPNVSLCFYWKSVARQVLASGRAHQIEHAEAAAYFDTRPLARQLGAWASAQSQPIKDRDELEHKVKLVAEKFGTTCPRCPPFWGGFRVNVSRWEFLRVRDDRLNDRWLYERNYQGWEFKRLQP